MGLVVLVSLTSLGCHLTGRRGAKRRVPLRGLVFLRGSRLCRPDGHCVQMRNMG